jgi:hypothetical protein
LHLLSGIVRGAAPIGARREQSMLRLMIGEARFVSVEKTSRGGAMWPGACLTPAV